MKVIKFLDKNNNELGGCNEQFFFERYFKVLDLSDSLKNAIQDKINLSNDFEFSVAELIEINLGLEQKIRDIIESDDFDAFKKESAIQYPQYQSNPIEYKGVVYYPYSKGNGFQFDLLFESLVYYHRFVSIHLEDRIAFKHIFKDL